MGKLLLAGAVAIALTAVACGKEKKTDHKNMVIEIATFELADGVTPESFFEVDRAVEKEHVAKQPGFLKRQSGYTEDGEWLAVVYWKSHEDAEASMASFADAPAAADFMSKMDVSTMAMKRYTKRD